ncbi:ATP synthase F1 subunit delta [Parapedobacter koreensis]|uniref:ATP synthase subunit delta n=1 Tax=Parapedobacter koreensis TaxID=332977 RepID=A0A1H7RHI8_9SPHI|nr:ATP synthase F1 subunit delta [Parapedobacter koreensis]SEL59575.1 ATP synthase F1 subcomplex delta subunit [Parapedobacter koreensis]
MSEFKVASRYAKSLIDLAQEQGNLETVKRDMEQFVAVLRTNKELQAVLKNPIMKQDKKSNILDALFGDKIHPSITAFFHIMVRKGRAGILYATAQEFIREYNEVKGIVHATVTSATALSTKNLDTLQKVIASEINAEVILQNNVDPSLIGGFVVKVGDRQIDASIAGKLKKLERHFDAQVVN